MTRTEILIIQLAEECAEVAKECSKALRFGLDNQYPDVPNITNRERIKKEMGDLLEVFNVLVEDGILGYPSKSHMEYKRNRIYEYLQYSKDCGILIGDID